MKKRISNIMGVLFSLLIFIIAGCNPAKKTLQYSILDIPKTTNDTIIPQNTKDMILYTYKTYNSDLQKKADNDLLKYQVINDVPYWEAGDGSLFACHYGETERYFHIIPSEKVFYSYMYYYYPSKKLYKIHQYAVFSSFVKIGKWLTFDENGKIIQEEDHDKKFLNVDYEKVLLFMESKGYIDLKTGKNRDKVFFKYFEKSKVWRATFFLEEKQSGDKKYIHYYINAKNGEVIETRNETIHYNPMDLPFLRDKSYKEKYSDNNWEAGKFIDIDKEVYKTYEGKSYTLEEWKIFEEKQYRIYSENRSKKGFWGNLLG